MRGGKKKKLLRERGGIVRTECERIQSRHYIGVYIACVSVRGAAGAPIEEVPISSADAFPAATRPSRHPFFDEFYTERLFHSRNGVFVSFLCRAVFTIFSRNKNAAGGVTPRVETFSKSSL